MNDWLLNVLTSTGVATVLVGVVTYLLQNVLIERMRAAVKSEFDAKLETHKAELAATNAKELEQFKSRLQIQAAQDGVAFSRLHERRITAIERTYRKLHDLHKAVDLYLLEYGLFDDETDKAHATRLSHAYADFNQDLVDLQLFLPRGIVGRLKTIDADLRDITGRFGSAVRTQGNFGSMDEYERQNTRFVTDIHAAINELHEDMRIALGDRVELIRPVLKI
ncbi:hypothetical protein [Pelomonas sp. KK5]|uniref:hypothetical protein n=1 Tax=Pelomonas sp. KK5 TaxID=1855730 RepID=UPI00117C61C9|nr:hypothetical protein [Pelomonas sp. KK5]